MDERPLDARPVGERDGFLPAGLFPTTECRLLWHGPVQLLSGAVALAAVCSPTMGLPKAALLGVGLVISVLVAVRPLLWIEVDPPNHEVRLARLPGGPVRRTFDARLLTFECRWGVLELGLPLRPNRRRHHLMLPGRDRDAVLQDALRRAGAFHLFAA